MSEILFSLSNGRLTQDEAEQLIHNLHKKKRGRPKKINNHPMKKEGKIGCPKKLSKYERNISIMAARVALDIHYPNLSATSKKIYLAETFCIGEKAIEAAITELNKRAVRKEVWVCQETKEIAFVDQEHINSVFFGAVLGPDSNVVFRKVGITNYIKWIPKKIAGK